MHRRRNTNMCAAQYGITHTSFGVGKALRYFSYECDARRVEYYTLSLCTCSMIIKRYVYLSIYDGSCYSSCGLNYILFPRIFFFFELLLSLRRRSFAIVLQANFLYVYAYGGLRIAACCCFSCSMYLYIGCGSLAETRCDLHAICLPAHLAYTLRSFRLMLVGLVFVRMWECVSLCAQLNTFAIAPNLFFSLKQTNKIKKKRYTEMLCVVCHT